jgi:hypothetical protein
MTRPFVPIGVAAAFWIAAPAALAQGPSNVDEIREAVIYHDGQHLFLTARPRFSTQAGRFIVAGDATHGGSTDGQSAPGESVRAPAASAAQSPAAVMAPDDTMPQGESVWDHTPLEYIALGLLFFIALWAIAYRPDRGARGGPTPQDRSEALDARLTYLDQRIADIERKQRRHGHHHKVA